MSCECSMNVPYVVTLATARILSVGDEQLQHEGEHQPVYREEGYKEGHAIAWVLGARAPKRSRTASGTALRDRFPRGRLLMDQLVGACLVVAIAIAVFL